MAFHVVAIKKDSKALLVMRRKGQVSRMHTPFTVWAAAAADASGELDAKQAAAAMKWARRKGWRVRLVKDGFPFIERQKGGVILPGDRDLLVKLNRVGRKMHRLVIVVSGYRTNYQQWQLRQKFLRGQGNLAARCCLKYDREVHSWGACGKQSQSNHSRPPRGHAVDCGLGMKSGYVSIGEVKRARKFMHDYGLCLPVGGEAWHVERGSVWRA